MLQPNQRTKKKAIKPPTPSSVPLSFRSDGKHIITTMPSLACHEQAQLPHALRALSGRRPPCLCLLLARAAVVLLVELLPAPLPLLLESLDDVNSAPHVRLLTGQPRLGFARPEVRQQAGRPGQRLGVRRPGPDRQRLEGDPSAHVHWRRGRRL